MPPPPLRVEVTIETPRLGFIKRGSAGDVDFVSPFPCPWNYGSIGTHVSEDGDPMDALVLGPRLARGARVHVYAHGAVGFTDGGIYEDKLICSDRTPSPCERRRVLLFFHFYARCKRLLNRCRGIPGPTMCMGPGDAAAAIARACPVNETR